MTALVVVRCGVGASIQDFGRPGRLTQALPPSGAMCRERLVAANESLGNARDAAGIELCLHGATFRAEGAQTISIDGQPRRFDDGETFDVPTTSDAVRYVALAGGVDVPMQLGSRSTLVVAKLGGLDGRFLRAGDRVRACASEPAGVREVRAREDDGSPIAVVPGPDGFPRETTALLLGAQFRISTAFDRVGVRLEGARLSSAGDRSFSTPMLRGAIQVTHDGTPIVLGPDHPTTGGYPVVATIVSAELDRFALRRPGDSIRFRLA